MKFKKIIIMALAFVLSMSVFANAKTLEFTMGANSMYESNDGIESFELENAPYTKNDRTMVPVRIISERFGATVDWDGEKSEITIVKGDKTIILTLGKAEAIVNGAVEALDVAPEEFNGRTMVPLRFVSETLGMDVDYIAATEQVLITDEAPVMTVEGWDITIDDYRSAMAYIGYDPEIGNTDEMVAFCTTMFKQIYSAATYVAKDGIPYTGLYDDEVPNSIEPYKEAIYQSALVAPVAGLLENDMKVVEYIYGILSSEKGAVKVQEKYDNEFVTAKHILISSEERTQAEAKKIAQDVLKKLKNGGDFDALMAEFSEDPGTSQYPQGYTFTKGEMVKEFEEAAFSLKEGEISGLVETDYGYHILKREPLAELDEYSYYSLAESVAADMYDEIIEAAGSKITVTVYMTDAEIADVLK